MRQIDLDELKTESILAVSKNMRVGHYGLQAHDEILLLRLALKDLLAVADAECVSRRSDVAIESAYRLLAK